jgi:hypothetical protein
VDFRDDDAVPANETPPLKALGWLRLPGLYFQAFQSRLQRCCHGLPVFESLPRFSNLFELPQSAVPASCQLSEDLDSSAARSRFDKRSSISSISIALAAWLKIESAARTRTDAGVLGSISSFSKVVAAAEEPC